MVILRSSDSPTKYYHPVKKRQTLITYLTGTRERILDGSLAHQTTLYRTLYVQKAQVKGQGTTNSRAWSASRQWQWLVGFWQKQCNPGVSSRTDQSERMHLANSTCYLLKGSRFFFCSTSSASTSRLALTIARVGTLLVREAFGSGRPSFRFKYLRSDIPPLYRAQNEAAQLSQDRTVPSSTVYEIISSFNYSLSISRFNYSLSQLTTNFFVIEK